MVSFKKLFFATSLLLSGVAAAPSAAIERSVAAAEPRSLERRSLQRGADASKVAENEFVTTKEIKLNSNSATVVNLSGCTALFFYKDTELYLVAHVPCGNEEAQSKRAAQIAVDPTKVYIKADSQARLAAAEKGIKEQNSHIQIHALSLYVCKAGHRKTVTAHSKSDNFAEHDVVAQGVQCQ